jgi:hypothetical protein
MKHETQISVPLGPSALVDPEMKRALSAYSRAPLVEEDSNPEVASELVWDQTSKRISETAKVPSNLCKWLTGEWQCEKEDSGFNPNREIAASACTPSALEQVEGDVEKAERKCLRRVKIMRNRLVPVIHELAKIYPCSSIQLSGFFLYPDGGYMGWHTNSDAPCTRVYITHVEEGGKSFFRYRDGGEYVTSWDKAGWNLRQFEVSKENPLWHCVYSEEPRLSIGFRINRNLLK